VHALADNNQTFSRSVHFFDKLLRGDSPCRVENEYPLVFQSSTSEVIFLNQREQKLSPKPANLLVLSEGDEIHAGLATLRRTVKLSEDSELRVLFIGSVVTDPKFRNQGLQRDLFLALDRMAHEDGLDALLLWSNQIDFYRKLGFELGGLQATWSANSRQPLLNQSVVVNFGKSSEIPLTDKWIQNFMQKQLVVRRSEAEMRKLWSIPEMYVAGTENAYALMKKGEDFDGMCHEWAGPADEVLACFDRLRAERQDVRFLSPGVVQDPEEMKVVSRLELAGFESRLEYLGLFKLMSNRFVIQDLQPETLKLPFFVWGLDSI